MQSEVVKGKRTRLPPPPSIKDVSQQYASKSLKSLETYLILDLFSQFSPSKHLDNLHIRACTASTFWSVKNWVWAVGLEKYGYHWRSFQQASCRVDRIIHHVFLCLYFRDSFHNPVLYSHVTFASYILETANVNVLFWYWHSNKKLPGSTIPDSNVFKKQYKEFSPRRNSY